MDDRLTEFRVGVVILATIFVLGILIMFFGELPSLVRDQYTLFIRFDEAPGVTVDTPVRKSGILIGRVTQVDLRDEGVLVTAKIDRKRKLTDNETCRISTNNIIGGDATLEFVQGRRGATGEEYRDGEYLEGYVARDPLQALSSVEDLMQVVLRLEGQVRQALVSFQTAGDEVGGVARSMNALIQNNQDQFQRIMGQAEKSMDRMEFAMGAIDDLLRDDESRAQLKSSIQQIPETLTEAREMMASFRKVAVRAEKNLANIEAFTEPLGQGGDAFFEQIAESLSHLDKLGQSFEKLGQLGDSVEDLDELIAQMVQFSRSINNPDGTLGRLVQSPELYDRLNRTVGNIEELTNQLQPIVYNANVATDKIARNPWRLGVPGVIYRQQSGIKH